MNKFPWSAKHKPLLIFLLQAFHVLCNMAAKDVFLEDLGIQLFGFWVIAREAFIIVWNVDTTIAGAF